VWSQRRAAVGLVEALPEDEKTLVLVNDLKTLRAYLNIWVTEQGRIIQRRMPEP
jgi:ABC-type multidrug transport system fused ATPase/permease subunit